MNNTVIEVVHISKKFGERHVLDDISFKAHAGQIIGISGPNGVGKSIFLRVLCGFLRPDDGQVTIWGQTVGRDIEFPLNTGILIDNPGFINHLTGLHNLKLLAMIQDKINENQIRHTMEMVGLDPNSRISVNKYSTGMRQRLGLAQALMEQPLLLILDEPTSGIDRAGTTDVQSLMRSLASEGKAIVLTSHSAQELSEVCDFVYEMEQGKLHLSHS